jgi:hypothetical protein
MLYKNNYTLRVSICQEQRRSFNLGNLLSTGSLPSKHLKSVRQPLAGMLDTFATDSVALRTVSVPA